MFNIKQYAKVLALAAIAAGGFTSCQDDFDDPAVDVPVAKNQPNITLAELKAEFWQEGQANYATKIEPREDGSHYIVHGTVISSDEAGNVFKNLVIDDGTAALPFSIDRYNLYQNYRRGQELVIDLTGMYIGMYNGYMQVGQKKAYNDEWEVSFMSPQTFTAGVELNGLPNLAAVDTLVVNSFDQIPATPTGLQTWQGRLVRFNNVHWQNGGVDTYSTYHSSGVSQNIVDINGATLAARTSGYSNFWNETLPEGQCDVVAILGYYGSAWQLVLLDGNNSLNIGKPTVAPGNEANPYSVAEAVALEEAGKTASNVWVRGYIVGTVAPEVETVTGNGDIEWGTDPTLANTVVISSDPEGQNLANALVLALPEGSPMREYVNIKQHPENVGKLLDVRGNLEKYMGTYGLTGNRGTASEFKLEGVEVGGTIPSGDGTQASPYNPGQVIGKNPTSTSEAVESGVWVKGYIVGTMPAEGTYLDKTVFGLPADGQNLNLVIAPTADCTDASKCVGVQLNTSIRAALNLVDNPGNLGKWLAVQGDIMKYCGGPGIKNVKAYELEGGVTPPTPATALYSVGFQDGTTGGFIVENKVGDSGWYAKSSNPACVIANSYKNGVNQAADSWLISPQLKLDGTDLTMSVKQGLGFYFPTAQDEFYTVLIKEVSATNWTQLTLTNFPTKGSGNWSSAFAENSWDIAAYAGKTVQVAFRYVNDGATSRAWELQDFSIKGNGKVEVVGSVTPDPDPTPDPTPDPDPDPDPTPDPTPGDAVTISAISIPHGDTPTATGDVSGDLTEGGYTISTAKNGGATAPAVNVYNGAGTLRLYADNTVTISGAAMAKIVFTLNTATGAKRYTTFTPSTGALNPAQASGDSSITWTGNATSVTFTVGHDATLGSDGASKRGQVHISSIEIIPVK